MRLVKPENAKILRNLFCITQQQMADVCGVTKQCISIFEKDCSSQKARILYSYALETIVLQNGHKDMYDKFWEMFTEDV